MIAEADIEDGIMIVALGERLFRGGNIDAGTVHKVLRHEINHFLSGDVSPSCPLKLAQQDSVAERREEQDFTSRRMEKILQRLKDGRWKAVVPWVRLESGKLHTTFPFYEGATELAAVLPEILEHKVFRVAERGYNRGNTLTAFIIANMVGIRSFLREPFVISITEKKEQSLDLEQSSKIDDFISGYRRVLDTPLGTPVLHQPHLALGYDEQIRTYLETLNSLDHTSKDFSETLKKMYDYIADHVGTLNQRCVELIENSSQ